MVLEVAWLHPLVDATLPYKGLREVCPAYVLALYNIVPADPTTT
jgi:hypothetical protein